MAISREEKLRWLAENLSNEQMAKLLEADAPNPMEGVPSNPGMETVDNPGAMKPTQQQGQQAQGQYTEEQIVDYLVKALQAGTIARASDPSGVLKIIGQNPAQVMIKAITKACDQMETNSDGDRNIVKGISALLSVLLKQKFSIAESVSKYLVSKGIDIKQLASNVRDKNVLQVFEAGKAACSTSIASSLNELENYVANIKKSLSPIASSTKAKALDAISESVEAMKSDDMLDKINEFYTCSSAIKKITSMLNENNIHPNKFLNMMKACASKNTALNEMMSAVKYSMSYYKKNKGEFEKKLGK